MASQRSLLESIALVSLLAPLALAQGNGGGNNNNNDSDDENDAETPTDDNDDEAEPTEDEDEPTPTQDEEEDEDEETTTEDSRPTPTDDDDEEDDTTDTPPTITSNPTFGNDFDSPDDLPTLTGFVDFSYPPPTVPPTVNAPFMQRSSLPDHTVFIVVGAILGAFGVAVLVWRAIVACLLHRSVERAAQAQHASNEKSAFLAPPAAFYKNNERESSPSVAAGAAAGRGTRRTNRGPTPSATPSQTNLFFSPTAAAGSSGMANRDSRFLPSGFYAASQSPSPALGHGTSVSMSNLRPDSRGQYSRNTVRDPSPEGSPQFAARRDPSMSSLNLNRPPSQRAPSAYLDDLLDDNPGMFPPSQMPMPPPPPPNLGPRHGHTFSHSSQGRY